jgi:hypothetical protein
VNNRSRAKNQTKREYEAEVKNVPDVGSRINGEDGRHGETKQRHCPHAVFAATTKIHSEQNRGDYWHNDVHAVVQRLERFFQEDAVQDEIG